MSKNYTIIKVTPNDVLFDLHPYSNPELTRRVFLNARNTKYPVPEDWALGVFQDAGVFELFKKGSITFDDNESITKSAFEHGVWFGEELDFEPAKQTQSNDILEILKTGNRSKILAAMDKYGRDVVGKVASANVSTLSQGVVSMLEGILKVQLVLDNNTSGDEQ